MSLSGVTIQVSKPAASARAESVPMRSSASNPATRRNGTRSARANASAGPSEAAMSSGSFSRWALYSG